jgi:hypothetical protein
VFVRHVSLDEDLVAGADCGARVPPVATASPPAANAEAASGVGTPDTRILLEDAYGADDGATVDVPGAAKAVHERERADVAEHADVAECADVAPRLLSLMLSFALPSSTYATMLIRELLKGSTAAAAHKLASVEAAGAAASSGRDVDGEGGPEGGTSETDEEVEEGDGGAGTGIAGAGGPGED